MTQITFQCFKFIVFGNTDQFYLSKDVCNFNNLMFCTQSTTIMLNKISLKLIGLKI